MKPHLQKLYDPIVQKHQFASLILVNEFVSQGHIICANNDGVILAYYHDFLPDGYLYYPHSIVEFVRSDEQDALYKHLCNNATHSTHISTAAQKDLKSLLESLIGAYLMLETQEGELHYGKLLHSNGTSLELQTFDMMGEWEDTLTFGVKDIFLLGWDTRFLQTFAAYMDKQE